MDEERYIALLLIATKDISRGEELVQDYGREGPQGPEFLFN